MLGGTIYAETYDNQNFETALELALKDATEGATIDCTYFKGKHTVTYGYEITKPVQLIFGDIDVTFTNTTGSNLFNIKSNNVIIKGQNRNTDKNTIYKGSTIFRMLNADNSRDGGYHIMSKGNKNLIIRDLTLIGLQSTLGRQYNNTNYPINGCGGIYIEKLKPEVTESANTCNAIRLQNLLIDKTKAHGIYLSTPILSLLKDIRISDCAGHGVFINGGTTTLFESVYIASCQMAGFCIYGHTYGTMLNCVAENCGCGFWIRSSFNISLFNPGIETTRSYGANPWKNSQPISKVYGFNLKTLSSTGEEITIPDVNSGSSGYFIGYGFIISGGRNISLYGPYAMSIGNSAVYEVYPNGTSKSKKLRYLLVTGNNRSSYIVNCGFKDGSGAAAIISNEIEIDSEVKTLELTYDVNETTFSTYTSPTPITKDTSLTAPILCLSDNVLIRSGKDFLTSINIQGGGEVG